MCVCVWRGGRGKAMLSSECKKSTPVFYGRERDVRSSMHGNQPPTFAPHVIVNVHFLRRYDSRAAAEKAEAAANADKLGALPDLVRELQTEIKIVRSEIERSV